MKEAADDYLSFRNTFFKFTDIRSTSGSGKNMDYITWCHIFTLSRVSYNKNISCGKESH